MRRNITSLGFLFLAALALVGCTSVEGGQPKGLYRLTIVTEGDHTFSPGENVVGDLVILGGHVQLAQGSRVEGSLVLVSGVATVDGRIDGDAWLMNGTLNLGPGGSVGRDVDHTGGVLEVAPGATVGGKVTQGGESALGLVRDSQSPGPGDLLVRSASLAILLAPLAFVLAALAGQPTRRIGRAAASQPLVALALGLLALIVVPALLVLMAFTLVLAPVVALLALLFGTTLLYGVIGLGSVLGQWIGLALRCPAIATRQTLSAPLGMIVLLLGLAVLSLAPVLEAIAVAVCLSLSTGAVLMTGFGSRTFVPADARQPDVGSASELAATVTAAQED